MPSIAPSLPKDATLASRIGNVLVTTHSYSKAIEYFSDAVVSDPSKTPLRYELASLFLGLKKHERAIGSRWLAGIQEACIAQ